MGRRRTQGHKNHRAALMQARRAGIFIAPSAALRLQRIGGEQGRGTVADKIVKPALAGDR